jgi:glutamate 5-kinase
MNGHRPLSSRDRIVVKIGSSSLTLKGGGIDDRAIERTVEMIAEARGAGNPTVLVSSGAVAAGLPALGLTARPRDLPGLQVAAAVGQVRLMERYATEFAKRDMVAGQVLLTKDILANRDQYLHARSALERMLGEGVVPIVNENDTVAVEELRLGDNDRLAAIVSHLVGAGLLLLLTDTPGLYSSDPRLANDAELLAAVRHTDEILDTLARGSSGPAGSGGVATKVSAARMAAWSGIPTIIASADDGTVLRAALAGKAVGTWVEPHPSGLPARKLWIAFGLPSCGKVSVDRGAARAVIEDGASLLAVGVADLAGEFVAGEAVEVLDQRGVLIAKGQVQVGAAEFRRVAGQDALAGMTVIHRDQLVVLTESS